jgi:hypothetical protein
MQIMSCGLASLLAAYANFTLHVVKLKSTEILAKLQGMQIMSCGHALSFAA